MKNSTISIHPDHDGEAFNIMIRTLKTAHMLQIN